MQNLACQLCCAYLYLLSKGSRGLIGCKSCVITVENSFSWLVTNHVNTLFAAVRDSNPLPNGVNSMKPKEFKQLKQQERIKSWNDKEMHCQYPRQGYK